jgi:hypothetical protein
MATRIRLLRYSATIVLLAGTATGAQSPDPAPARRVPLEKSAPYYPVLRDASGAVVPDGLERRLVVKFVDELRARSTPAGGIASATGSDLTAVRDVAALHGFAFAPLLTTPQAVLDDLERRAAMRSGVAQPDLAGMLRITFPSRQPNAAELVLAGTALNALPQVELAWIEVLGVPPPGDIAPPTPDLTSNQGWRHPDPGVDGDFAAQHGITGAGIRVSDCEYNWVSTHEDLVDQPIHPEPGQTPVPDTVSALYDEHGTAALGEIVAVANGYGCTGLAPDAEPWTYPEWTIEGGFRRVEAITHAIAASQAGDVVMLEMQQYGAGFNYGPAELDPAVWLVSKTGVDAGVVVVGAAGNGNQNLDHPVYASYMAQGDSGAILVGAGSPYSQHDKLDFSTYGSRVNLQGWGVIVFTLGYGNFAEYGGDKNQRYTGGFNGTSSATPLVAGACCLLQQWAIRLRGATLSPLELRQLLIDTGRPQGIGGNIGPLPDIQAAALALPWLPLGGALEGSLGQPKYRASGPLIAGTSTEHVLEGALAYAPAFLVAGQSVIDLPFLGGVLVPSPDVVIRWTDTNSSGAIEFDVSVPAGLPSGLAINMQWWLVDSVGPQGFAASNAVHAVTP